MNKCFGRWTSQLKRIFAVGGNSTKIYVVAQVLHTCLRVSLSLGMVSRIVWLTTAWVLSTLSLESTRTHARGCGSTPRDICSADMGGFVLTLKPWTSPFANSCGENSEISHGQTKLYEGLSTANYLSWWRGFFPDFNRVYYFVLCHFCSWCNIFWSSWNQSIPVAYFHFY